MESLAESKARKRASLSHVTKKKVVLFPKNGRVKIFLSLTRQDS